MSHRNEHRLSQEQEDAVIALLNSPSVSKAAEQVGIAGRTLYRWLEQPEFAEKYRRARREAFCQAIAQTQRYAVLAVNTLAKIMADSSSSTTAKVAAAVAILRFGREGIELDDIEARVAALEQAHGLSSRQRNEAA